MSGVRLFFCFKHKTAYEMRISDWSADVCASDLALLLVDRHVEDVLPEAAAVMLLEEACLGAALRAANQAHRTVGGPGEHQRRDGAIIIGELALRDLRLGEDDAADRKSTRLNSSH